MRRLYIIGVLVSMIGIFLGCSQQKGIIKSPQGEPAADSNAYVIGPEDVLDIQVWKEQALSGKVIVRADGKISLPLIQEVQAAGLTPLQLQESLVDKLKELVESPNVSVIVIEANSFKVFISGEVKSPGVHRLRTETTLLQIIPMVGGFTDWANQKKILILRVENGQEKRIITNYKKMVDGKIPALVLRPGDNIIVP